MAKYSYKVRDTENRLQTGYQEANSEDEVLRLLSERGLRVTDLEELNFDGSRKNQTFTERLNARLSMLGSNIVFKDVVFFTRQLATMVEAGVPLARALGQLAKGQSPALKKVILKVQEDISIGNTFSEAIAKHPTAFDNMYVSVVRSGEVTGALDRVLNQMASYMENMQIRKAKIKGAMRYPTFIFSFVVIVIFGILWKLVPIFEGLYGGRNVALPVPTQILIYSSHTVQNNFFLVLILVILVVVGFWLGMLNAAFRANLDALLLKIPVFGDLLKKSIWATFCRTLALLMESGTPILQAVEICAAVVGNQVFVKAIEKVHYSLKTGALISASLEEAQVFPVLVCQLVATGEETGRVDALLVKASDFYDREINVTVDSLASVIEPFLIIILGTLVGSVLIALYLPVFSLGKLLN
jgi:type IV pilus assembly protein PilC